MTKLDVLQKAKEISLSSVKNSQQENKLDTIDSKTYYAGYPEKWFSILKNPILPTDLFRCVGLTTYKNLDLDSSEYFVLRTWKELRELNKAFRNCGLWHFQNDFLNRVKRLLKELAYDSCWCDFIAYYPKTMRSLLISPESMFDDDSTTPVVLVAPKLQGLDHKTRMALKEVSE